jgi:predicted nucleotidyltransferase
MRSLVRKQSLDSVTVFWLDRGRAVNLLTEMARALGTGRREVKRVGVFGSLAEGRAVPGSDADVIIVLARSEKRAMDRRDDYIGYFGDLPLGVDLFCYTEEETHVVPLARRACATARWLYERP